MIRAYVTCNVGHDTDAIGEHLEFHTLPREGEVVRVACPEHSDEIRVLKVIHRVSADGGTAEPISPVMLECEYICRHDQ